MPWMSGQENITTVVMFLKLGFDACALSSAHEEIYIYADHISYYNTRSNYQYDQLWQIRMDNGQQTEAALHKSSQKKGFGKYAANLQENIHLMSDGKIDDQECCR